MSGRVVSMSSRPAQLGLCCEGMAPEVVSEDSIADVFRLWAVRVAESDEACAAIAAGVTS